MWTRSSGPYPTAKDSAVIASLLSHETLLALWALVDDAGAWHAAREWRQGGRRVPLAPGCLTTRVIAKATPTMRSEAALTHRTHAGTRSVAIVTRRGVRHAHFPCAGAALVCV